MINVIGCDKCQHSKVCKYTDMFKIETKDITTLIERDTNALRTVGDVSITCVHLKEFKTVEKGTNFNDYQN